MYKPIIGAITRKLVLGSLLLWHPSERLAKQTFLRKSDQNFAIIHLDESWFCRNIKKNFNEL